MGVTHGIYGEHAAHGKCLFRVICSDGLLPGPCLYVQISLQTCLEPQSPPPTLPRSTEAQSPLCSLSLELLHLLWNGNSWSLESRLCCFTMQSATLFPPGFSPQDSSASASKSPEAASSSVPNLTPPSQAVPAPLIALGPLGSRQLPVPTAIPPSAALSLALLPFLWADLLPGVPSSSLGKQLPYLQSCLLSWRRLHMCRRSPEHSSQTFQLLPKIQMLEAKIKNLLYLLNKLYFFSIPA